MAITVKNNVIRLTADADTFTSAGRIKIKGVRLIAGADAATAQIKNTAGDVLMTLQAAAAGVDESQICFFVDSGSIVLGLTGTSPEVFIYLE